MIVFWHKAVEEVVATQGFQGTNCPLCGQKGGLRVDISNDRIENLFWTVSMPHKGFASVCCEKCEEAVPAGKWPIEVKTTADRMRGAHRNRFRLLPSKWFVILLVFAIGGAFVGRAISHLNPSVAEAQFKERSALETALAFPESGTVLAVTPFEGAGSSEGRYVLIEKAEIPVADGDFHDTRVVIRLSSAAYTDEDFYKGKSARRFSEKDFGEEIDAEIKTSLVKAPLTWRDPASKKTVYYKVWSAYPDAVR